MIMFSFASGHVYVCDGYFCGYSGCKCGYGNAMEYMWRPGNNKNNLKYWSSPSTLFETVTVVFLLY